MIIADKEFYFEVCCTYYNEEGFWTVDAWESDNEEGKVLAVIHVSGDVYYIEPEARYSALVQEVISEKIKELKGEQQ